ncbi:VENN motif pre-toxin domain-containing protein [Rodentibacter heidelbergensis]|uniref:VENN motif-containing domain-containing protein n=1 Tax=Rodentibacter heidelbergensis TaxID=1908258 RepID=A0A1V3ID04_9PAST|nr:hypothetical protein BKK48_01635 [Rodentibacter heidelbergensis]
MKAKGTSDQQGSSFITATAGAEAAKRAVENNPLEGVINSVIVGEIGDKCGGEGMYFGVTKTF